MRLKGGASHFRRLLTMHDIRAIRLDPDAYDNGWRLRGAVAASHSILSLDKARRAAQTALQLAQARRRSVSEQVGRAKVSKDAVSADLLMAEAESLKDEIARQTRLDGELATGLQELLAGLPNLPAADTPPGLDETGNLEVRCWGRPDTRAPAKDHVDIGAALGLMDFDAASRMSGARFVVLRGELARLERALGQFMLDIQTQEHGYTEVSAAARQGRSDVRHGPVAKVRGRPV